MWLLRLLLRRLYITCIHSAEGGSKLAYVNVAFFSASHLDKGMAVRAMDEVLVLSPELLYLQIGLIGVN